MVGFTLSRHELYQKVWQEPLTTLAPKFGISDVMLGRICAKANIPRPPIGYWAKVKANKPVMQTPLPERLPGATDVVQIGYSRYHHPSNYLMIGPIPEPPQFSPEMTVVREKIKKRVGKVPYYQISKKTHAKISKLLKDEEQRAIKYAEYPFSWYAPRFTSPIDKRRLRILNAIFLGCQKFGCKPGMTVAEDDSENIHAYIQVGNQSVSVDLDIIRSKKKSTAKYKKSATLRLIIRGCGYQSADRQVWEETADDRIEKHLTEIVNEIIVAGELNYRESAQREYEWIMEERREKEEQERQRIEEEKRRAEELRLRREQENIDSLLSQASALQQAEIIRSFVSNILERAKQIEAPASDIENWAAWAIKQADRIDPLLKFTFLKEVNITD